MHWNRIRMDNEIYTYEYFQHRDVCRLCWNKNANTELFHESLEDSCQKSLVDIIKDCLDIEIHNNIPRKLCESCNTEVKRFYSFKQFCRETDKKLKEILLCINELQNKEPDLISVKDEVFDINFDTYIDDAVDNIDYRNKHKLTQTKFKRKTRKDSVNYCNICGLQFKTKEELSTHNNEFHGLENAGTIFKCIGCEKQFATKKLRNSHEVNFCKQLKDGYKCNICDRYLPKRYMYERHMGDHIHNTLTELPELLFKCRKCVMTFKTNALLKEHMVEHERKKKFVCDTCGRIFTRQDYLYKHKLSHSGIKRHECPHCEFKAVQRSSLTVHMRKHTGDRPYSCDICPQQCISSSNLHAHKRRHLGLKKYECAICNKKFGYKISLEEHISSTHVRSESHPCTLCGATYTRLRGLKRHLAAKHGKENTKNVHQNVLIQVIKASTELTGVQATLAATSTSGYRSAI